MSAVYALDEVVFLRMDVDRYAGDCLIFMTRIFTIKHLFKVLRGAIGGALSYLLHYIGHHVKNTCTMMI